MPAFKLTKDLFVKSKSEIIITCETNGDGECDSLMRDVWRLLEVDNAKQQVDLFKKTSKEIGTTLSSQGSQDVVKPLKFLVQLFFICTTKNPLRRLLISTFQNLPEDIRTAVIKPAIVDCLQKLYEDANISRKTAIQFDQTGVIRHNVDTISAVTENFPLGVECMSVVSLETLAYLADMNQQLFSVYSAQLSPVQQNEMMHHCLETVKLTNRICQKAHVTMETKLKQQLNMAQYLDIVAKCICTDIRVLKSDDFLLDCKTTSAMNICLMLKYTDVQNTSLGVLSSTVFHHIDWLSRSHDNSPLPDWLKDLKLDQLSRSMLSSSSYLCLCYGVLAMVSMDELLYEESNLCFLLDALLPEFLKLSKSCSEIGSKLLAAKSICFLTQRLREHVQTGCVIPGRLAVRLHGNSRDMETLLHFVFTAWEDAVDAIRYTVRDIFQNVVDVHIACKHKSEDISDDPFLHKLSLTILNDVSWSCKGKYGTLSVLVGHLGSARMLLWHPGIAKQVLQQLQEQTLACYASELYERLFISHMTELCRTNQSEDRKVWFKQWVEPVLDILCQSNTLQKKHTIEYVLPRLLKSGDDTFQYIIDTLTSQLTDTAHTYQTESKLGALILCLRRARAMGQLKQCTKVKDKHKVTKGKAKVKIIDKITSTDMKVRATESMPAGHSKDITDHEKSANDLQPNVSDLKVIGNVNVKDFVRECDKDPKVETEKWYGVVDVCLLRQALICREEQVRLDGFALLCENQKTSETINSVEIDLVKSFIPDNLNNQNPAFRQQFVSLVKKFLSRMKESRAAVRRQVAKVPAAVTHLHEYQDFLTWLTGCMFSNLYPGSVFARRTTCLSTLTLLMNIYGDSGCEEFNFYCCIEDCDIHTLLYCLTDTFEDNKQEAANILIACSNMVQNGGVMDASLTKETFEIALSLSHSTRPQDSTTAAYLFSVLTHQPTVHAVLTRHIQASTHTGNNESEQCKQIQSEATDDEKEAQNENENQIEATVSGNEAGSQKEFLNIRNMAKDNLSLLQYVEDVKDDELGRRYLLLLILMQSLESQCKTAQTSLIVAAANKPLYPTIQCMRYCFTGVDFRTIPAMDLPAWKLLLARFTSLCHDIAAVVSPVVCNSSPEGNIPIETLPAGDVADVSVHKSQETVMLMPEYLIVCCWRSVKEISLILGQLTASAPIGDQHALLSFQQVVEIGEYFTTLLLESKHRGAFELAYAGFVKVTDMLWRSSRVELHQLPRKWLMEVMTDIKSADPGSRLCATRRSAGVPFYVQALVTTELSSTGRQCFRLTMQELLSLALDETIITLEASTAKVHALNILRALYKDARLRDDVAPYTADGLKVAILGFKSPLWAVRNSATLLMTAMMTRVFGVKRTKDESSFSRKNCQTGRTFFYNYPSMYQFLLDEIAIATQEIANQLHPGLFPILMVLGRLFPSAMEGTDTSLNLAAFIPFVIKCNASPVLKTREMAAKALQPLVDKDHVTSVFNELLTLLPFQPNEPMRQNQIHGALLQLQQMFKTVPLLPQCTQNTLGQLVCTLWQDRMTLLISRQNPCLLTRKLAMEVCLCVIHHYSGTTNISALLYNTLKEETTRVSIQYDQHTPSFWEFKTTVCQLLVGYFDTGDKFEKSSSLTMEDFAIGCLTSDLYEVRQVILKELHGICDSSDIGKRNDIETEEATDLNKIHHNVCTRPAENVKQSKGGNCYLTGSSKIYTTLVDMLGEETHEECLEHLLRLLYSWPAPLECLPVEKYETVMKNLLNTVETKKYSDKVLASCVAYAGRLLQQMWTMCNSLYNSQAEGGPECTVMFISVIRDLTRQMETDTDILLACATALQLNFQHLSSVKNMRDVCAVYSSVLDLLQADDLEVREITAAILDTACSDSWRGVKCQPYVAMSHVLVHWINSTPSTGHLELAFHLITIILHIRPDSQMQEERLFDRGEINTYWDELDFIKTVNTAVCRTLCSGSDLTLESVAEQESDSPFHDIEELIHRYLADSEDIQLATLESHFQNMFTNTQQYQKHIIAVYKSAVVCLLGLKMKAKLDKDVLNMCMDILEKLQTGSSVDFLPRYVREKLKENI